MEHKTERKCNTFYKMECKAIPKQCHTEYFTVSKTKQEIAPLDALYPKIQVYSDSKTLQTLHRLNAMHKSTYQEDVKYKNPREDEEMIKTNHQKVIITDNLHLQIGEE